MNYTLCLVSILFSIALASFGAGQHRENKKPRTDITGHVYDKTSKPLSGAILKLYDCDASVVDCEKPVGGARSLADGTFVVEAKGMKEGVYTLEATMPPFYLAKAKVPVFIPQDYGRSFDFLMQRDVRDPAGNLVGVSADDAKEIYAAARIEKNTEVAALSAKIVRQHETQWAQLTTVNGCLDASGGDYVLSDKSGKTYTLTGDKYALSEHVGHNVRVTGSEVASNTGAPDKFLVKSVTILSDACPPRGK